MRTRPDGWPLCPKCGEDELYCLMEPACVCRDMRCYRCGWIGNPAAYPDWWPDRKSVERGPHHTEPRP